MSKPFGLAFAGAVLVIIAIIAFISHTQRGNRLEPAGRILHVRSVAIDASSSAVIVDFELQNPSDREMVVRFITVELHKSDGTAPEATAIAASDLPVLFRYHQDELGALANAPMRERDRVAPHQTVRASTAVRVEAPEADVKSRRDIELVIEDVTGPKLQLTSK